MTHVQSGLWEDGPVRLVCISSKILRFLTERKPTHLAGPRLSSRNLNFTCLSIVGTYTTCVRCFWFLLVTILFLPSTPSANVIESKLSGILCPVIPFLSRRNQRISSNQNCYRYFVPSSYPFHMLCHLLDVYCFAEIEASIAWRKAGTWHQRFGMHPCLRFWSFWRFWRSGCLLLR